jgi:hypothetical protein
MVQRLEEGGGEAVGWESVGAFPSVLRLISLIKLER